MSLVSRLGLKSKIAIPTVLVLATSVFTLVALTSTQVKQTTEAEAIARSNELAHRYSNQIRLEFEEVTVTMRGLSATLGSLHKRKELNRAAVNDMLKEILVSSPAFFGIWTCWEPNAFDGRDAEFANKAIHDETGRFIPYWHLGSGKPETDLLRGYETPGDGDYYLIARNTKKEAITELTSMQLEISKS